MDWSDVYTIVAILAFWWICDWAAPASKGKRAALVFAGFVLLAIGGHNGFQAGKAWAIRDAKQSAILTSPEMPR